MSLVSSLKKVATVSIYLLVFLGIFELRNIFLSPTMKNLEILFACLILACVVSFMHGFKLFKSSASQRSTR
ncbi:MAG: hypothetical protein BGO43_03275 [Gammaproteobacteria bacterium 39-13]|nr:MAG: hypothetical protein BGO43_03275 [Gammaproteobacteria bacterium 39-13]